MGSRRVYRGIEEAALLGNFRDCGCPHTIISRRLRFSYRESRDLMYLRMSRVEASASMYGNQKLDVMVGYKNVMRACDSVADMIHYMDRARRFPDKATLDYRNVHTQVMLLRELRKNISKDAAIKEMEDSFGSVRPEKHVLGGSMKAGKGSSGGPTNG